MWFPFGRRFGKRIPFQGNILGCSFRSPPHLESASYYLAENWGALSGRLEPRPRRMSSTARHPRHPPERATLAASMPPRTARLRARHSQTNFKRTRVGHAAFLATYRPVLAGRSFGGHQLSRAAQAVPAARDTCDRRFWLHRDLPRHAPAPPRRH